MTKLWRSIFSACWRQSPRAFLRSIVALDDTPHHIALGTAVGVFVGLTPTSGMQMLLVLAISGLVRFNRAAGVLATYISNPLTGIPLAYLNYRVGILFCESTLTAKEFVTLVTSDWWHNWRMIIGVLFSELGLPYLVGSLVVATISALLTYPGVIWLVRAFHKPPAPPLPREPAVASQSAE